MRGGCKNDTTGISIIFLILYVFIPVYAVVVLGLIVFTCNILMAVCDFS